MWSIIIQLIPVFIIVFLIFYVISAYNNLIALQNQFKNAFSQIDVQYTTPQKLYRGTWW